MEIRIKKYQQRTKTEILVSIVSFKVIKILRVCHRINCTFSSSLLHNPSLALTPPMILVMVDSTLGLATLCCRAMFTSDPGTRLARWAKFAMWDML